jgi:cytochrome c553
MNPGRAAPSRDRRFAVWLGGTAALFLAAAMVGFLWMPSVQAGRNGPDWWGAICSAVGLPTRDAQAGTAVAGKPASDVAWTAATRQLLASGNASHGAVLAAASCNACHGQAGVSDDAIFPNLAGQSAASIYKQLQDFKSGMRGAAVMGPYAVPLSDGDMRDLAAHYASLPRAAARAPDAPRRGDATLRLIEFGDPMRGIVACAACHGPLGFTTAAPSLHGQQRAYLEAQLQALAGGRRHNDISAQMRSIARSLTPQEINSLAAYYAGVDP